MVSRKQKSEDFKTIGATLLRAFLLSSPQRFKHNRLANR